jgi:hypothetical protein
MKIDKLEKWCNVLRQTTNVYHLQFRARGPVRGECPKLRIDRLFLAIEKQYLYIGKKPKQGRYDIHQALQLARLLIK